MEGLRQENIAIKARVTALEYQNGQLWAAARCAMQAAKETKDALETLQSNMETKKEKHKKKHDKGEKIRAEGKQVTTTEDEVPMKQEQQSSNPGFQAQWMRRLRAQQLSRRIPLKKNLMLRATARRRGLRRCRTNIHL